MKRFDFVFFLVLLAWCFPVIANGQIIKKPVAFKQDSVGTTLKDKITGEQVIDYQLTVKAGQFMNVNLETNHLSNYFNILPPGSEDVAVYNSSVYGNKYNGTLEKSGTYTIRVYLMRSSARRKESATYSLRLEVYNSDGGE